MRFVKMVKRYVLAELMLLTLLGINWVPFKVFAQPINYPNKSINLLIPFAPGGNLDIIG